MTFHFNLRAVLADWRACTDVVSMKKKAGEKSPAFSVELLFMN
jgi:hypothetical protein